MADFAQTSSNKCKNYLLKFYSKHGNLLNTIIPRCGSVIVHLALKYSSTVRESEVLSILRDVVKSGRFGDSNVSAITGTRDTRITPTAATTPTSSFDGMFP